MNKDEIKKALECCILADGNSCKTCPYLFYENCKSGAVAVQDAINLISEQEKEIERLKAENERVLDKLADVLMCVKSTSEIDVSKLVKQAKIEVLKELKTRHDYAIKNMGYPWDISQQIDKLIKEIEE